MLKIMLVPVALLSVAACDPGFKINGMVPPPADLSGVDEDAGSSGSKIIPLDLTMGMTIAGKGIGINLPIVFTGGCPASIPGSGGSLTATSNDTCQNGAGTWLTSCTYQISPGTLSVPGVQAGTVLQYTEDKRLPFHEWDNGMNDNTSGQLDSIATWAAIIVKYVDKTSDTLLSAEVEPQAVRTMVPENRLFHLRHPMSQVSTITFSAFLGCASANIVGLNRTANSNGKLNLTGTFSWKVSNLAVQVTP